MDGWTNGEIREQSGVMPLYLGLFLTLLAFFIMFIGTSLPDRNPPTSGATVEGSTTAATDANVIALAAVAGAFQRLGATLTGSPADAVTGLDVTVPARSLFADREATIRPAAIAALDRTATALATPRGNSRLVLQVTNGLGDVTATAAAVHRTAGLAAQLLRRGAPPDAFLAGTAPLAAGVVRFRFRLVGNADDLATAF